MKRIKIEARAIGEGCPCFVIAEAGVNHNGDFELARELVAAASAAGADAVKFQTFSTERLVTRDAPQAEYQRRNIGKMENQFDMLKRLELTKEAHHRLLRQCRDLGMVFLSTPFEAASADFLESIGVPAFKLSSGEVTNTPFLAHVARKGRPMILSTGMSTLDEVRAAVACVRETGNTELALLHCVSSYPCDASDCNLRAMQTMASAFDLAVGFSDHSEGIAVALGAAALGACIVEKHFTMDRNLPGPDHGMSLEPDELARMVAGIRKIEAAMGDGEKAPTAAEQTTATCARKSLVALCEIPAGSSIRAEMIVSMRPGTGIPPSRLHEVVGRTSAVAIPAGAVLTPEMLA